MSNKTVTIKGATDQELDDLLIRLRKEVEAQGLVSSLIRQGMNGYVPYDQLQGVSTEKPVESMYHVGVLGMHWGRRKGPAGPINVSEDHKKKMALKGKKLSEMSNAELKAFNERMQLERQYKDLKKSDFAPGRKVVQDILASSAKEVAKNYISKYAAKGIDGLIKKALKS